jgi:hypothetical protein
MSPTQSTQAPAATQIAPSVIQPTADTQTISTPPASPKTKGYGLPCAKCKTYFSADLKNCPVCKSTERVSARVAAPPRVAPADPLPDPAILEEERERFLKDFQTQLYASQMQVNVNADANFRCTLEENHQGSFESASVCKSCYENLQERADLMVAALHMDVKEAAQVVYDAVWSDPSDPSKTYQNAAQSLLTEIRKRAGISAVLGPFQALPH